MRERGVGSNVDEGGVLQQPYLSLRQGGAMLSVHVEHALNVTQEPEKTGGDWRSCRGET